MDLAILALINRGWTHPWLDALMIMLTTAGVAWFGLVTVMVWRRGEKRLGWSLLLAQAVALLGVSVFYWLAARVRPDAVRLVMDAPPFPSFPSGHSALAVTTATVWWLHYGWSKRTLSVAVLAFGVAYSRLYLGHHYPTDVLAGVVLGVGVGAAGHGISHNWGDQRAMISWLLWPQVSLALMVTMMAYIGLLPLYLLTWPFADKVLHMLLIGALAFYLNLWVPEWQIKVVRLRLPVAVALPFAVAAVEEAMQSWSPLRTFDFGDLASDFVGLLLFYILSRWMGSRMDVMARGSAERREEPGIAG